MSGILDWKFLGVPGNIWLVGFLTSLAAAGVAVYIVKTSMPQVPLEAAT